MDTVPECPRGLVAYTLHHSENPVTLETALCVAFMSHSQQPSVSQSFALFLPRPAHPRPRPTTALAIYHTPQAAANGRWAAYGIPLLILANHALFLVAGST